MQAAASTPLDRALIQAELARRGIAPLPLDVLSDIDSTNRYLHQRGAAPAVCLAESQSAGRGRRGRAWVSTPCANLMLSLAWRFDREPAAVIGLSLAAGLAVLRALDDFGVTGAALKWPNDIVWNQRKLAGLLLDVDSGSPGTVLAIIGVGINGYLAAADAAHIDQPWVDLLQITGATPDRNRLAALVVAHLLAICRDFDTTGFVHFRAEWEQRHALQGQAVRLLNGSAAHDGVVVGIDANGALRLRAADGRESLFHSGDVSLRSLGPRQG
jgi:BirA family transcriptional regulator, biotin operon repressor / biotin---[acetyl-CoA-carboxylase] ligase